MSAYDVALAVEWGTLTFIRVALVTGLAVCICVPLGVWLGRRREGTQATTQLVLNLLATFPTNIAYPLAACAIITWHLNATTWLTLLILVGACCRLLRQITEGMAAFPADLLRASRNLGVNGLLRWNRLILPGLATPIAAGAASVANWCWNAAILAEFVSWNGALLRAPGLGAMIAQASRHGEVMRVVTGVAIMTLFIAATERLFWSPLQKQIAFRFNFTATPS